MIQKINVEGMMCGNCEARLTRVLKSVDGISNVVASYQNNMVEVEYDETVLDSQVILEAIEDAGFDVVA